MITEHSRIITDLSSLRTVIDSYREDKAEIRWIFRGDTNYKAASIQSSIERFFCREGVSPGDQRRDVEEELIREFKRAYHQYAYHLPESASTVEWLSLMQHYGAPTRLVDFTYSPYVATYFALEEDRSEYIVWGLNSNWANKLSLSALKRKHPKIAGTLNILAEPATDSPNLTRAQRVFFQRPFARMAFPQNPFRLNERLRIQRGVFVLQGDLNSGFMDNLIALSGHYKPTNALKLRLKKANRRKILKELHHMNIARTSLFPGIDGYAKSLGVYLPRLEGMLRK
jgi:hypothetical protein